jgi:ssDNA-binding replication factor A large subunit
MIIGQFGEDITDNTIFNDISNVITDVLGVVTTSSDVQHIVQRTTGKELIKRDVSIVDDSGTMVSDLLMPIFLFIC